MTAASEGHAAFVAVRSFVMEFKRCGTNQRGGSGADTSRYSVKKTHKTNTGFNRRQPDICSVPTSPNNPKVNHATDVCSESNAPMEKM